MSKKPKTIRPKARLPKGLRDVESTELRAVAKLLGAIGEVYESYGFDPLETPAFEYTDALGKFLPDVDRPNAGVFSFQDEDEQWLSLRYDLTAPLARYVAANYDTLPKPFRRYQSGPVWRNEKPGPGRYREFIQFDADTVGTASPAADAEMCMLAADALERVGIPRGDYVIRVNNRKVVDGMMEAIGVTDQRQKLTVLRAIDKFDRLSWAGVKALLGEGRTDESGDYTPGAKLSDRQIANLKKIYNAQLFAYLVTSERPEPEPEETYVPEDWGEGDEPQSYEEHVRIIKSLQDIWDSGHRVWHDGTYLFDELMGLPISVNEKFYQGVEELQAIHSICVAAGYTAEQIQIDISVVRGLDYYTGPVFEAELTFETKDEKGRPVRFGSVGGGGRYDGLVARFKGIEVPATGFSVGVSRLYAALQAIGRSDADAKTGPVVVLVMDRDRLGDYQKMTRELREAGIRAEMYVGESGMRAQMKYADKRAAPCVVIEGADEHEAGEVTVKDLAEGARLSKEIEDNVAWREGRPAQVQVKRDKLVEAVRDILRPDER